jgi:hypothetical protein
MAGQQAAQHPPCCTPLFRCEAGGKIPIIATPTVTAFSCRIHATQTPPWPESAWLCEVVAVGAGNLSEA